MNITIYSEDMGIMFLFFFFFSGGGGGLVLLLFTCVSLCGGGGGVKIGDLGHINAARHIIVCADKIFNIKQKQNNRVIYLA